MNQSIVAEMWWTIPNIIVCNRLAMQIDRYGYSIAYVAHQYFHLCPNSDGFYLKQLTLNKVTDFLSCRNLFIIVVFIISSFPNAFRNSFNLTNEHFTV